MPCPNPFREFSTTSGPELSYSKGVGDIEVIGSAKAGDNVIHHLCGEMSPLEKHFQRLRLLAGGGHIVVSRAIGKIRRWAKFDPEIAIQEQESIEDCACGDCYTYREVAGGFFSADRTIDFRNFSHWSGHITVKFLDIVIHVAGLFMEGLEDGTNCFRHYYCLAAPTAAIGNSFLDHLKVLEYKERRELAKDNIFLDQNEYRKRPTSSWDDLILPEGMRELVETNVSAFYDARDTFKKYGIPYRRGIILAGPPGDGKTSIIRTLLAQEKRFSCFIYGISSEHANVDRLGSLLRVANSLSPAIVVVEDIDRLVSQASMRQFLNMLDGLDSQDGILIIATSNEPEKLDAALAERPSRFDSIIRIGHPDDSLREKYARFKIKEEFSLTEKQISELVHDTAKFSMAQMQEVRSGAFLISVREKQPPCWEHVQGSVAAQKGSLSIVKRASKVFGFGDENVRK